MNKLYRYIRGYLRVRLQGAGVEAFVNIIAKNRIPFWDPMWYDSFSVEISIFKKDFIKLKELANTSFLDVINVEHVGIQNILKVIRSRIVLLLGVLISIILILYLQNYLLFYDVVGNLSIPKSQIIRALEESDIGVGTLGARLNTKRIKDHVLQKMPDLQWITVTQNGCMAKVIVRERTSIPTSRDRKGYANIVALKSGIITSQSVFEGQPLKAVGDNVLKDELLVSGVVDLERVFAVVHAQAEIFARTWYEKEVVIPQNCLSKHYQTDKHRSIWLEIGKHQIKIFGNSGIPDTSCDKIVTRKELTLPGGYRFPVSILQECYIPYQRIQTELSEHEAQWSMEKYALESVMGSMVSGEIIKQGISCFTDSNRIHLRAIFECHEMISKTVEGKWKKEDFIE